MATEIPGVSIAPNWTSAAGALEGILDYLGAPLPRHAIMGLTGHSWHTCIQQRANVTALPGGPADLDWEAMVRRYSLTGYRWERFGAALRDGDDWSEMRDAAVEWAIQHLDSGRPLIGWDFHLHEFAVVFGYDRNRGAFLVDDVLSPELGAASPWAEWPPLGRIELFAPREELEIDVDDAVVASLTTALECFAGRDGPGDGQPRGTAGLETWADVLDGDDDVDRAGNAYTLAVLQAARLDGADYLADLASSLPVVAEPLRKAERAIRDEAQALAPLITLFPFPSGGHGNVANPGLRRAAAMPLRRAVRHEIRAAEAIAEALRSLEGD